MGKLQVGPDSLALVKQPVAEKENLIQISFKIDWCRLLLEQGRYYLPTPPLGQDMTQGHFLSGV